MITEVEIEALVDATISLTFTNHLTQFHICLNPEEAEQLAGNLMVSKQQAEDGDPGDLETFIQRLHRDK